MSSAEQQQIDRLNRIGMAYFRPLVMAILKNVQNVAERIRVFKLIERFIFIAFRMTAIKSNYRSSEFYNAAREMDRGNITISEIEKRLEEALLYTFNNDKTLRIADFYNLLHRKFQEGSGYYGWSGLRYFLYEYELSLLSESRQKKVDWSDLLKTPKDKISTEHIYPQTETDEWTAAFKDVAANNRRYYKATLGNLLLLSSAINSALQNDGFSEKKKAKCGSADRKVRNGYSDGSHSEIEVSREDTWGPKQIKDRGLKLLTFMEERWGFKFSNEEDKKKILFLPDAQNAG